MPANIVGHICFRPFVLKGQSIRDKVEAPLLFHLDPFLFFFANIQKNASKLLFIYLSVKLKKV